MTQWTLKTSTTLAALLAGTAAFADITPEEVWQNWQDTSASYGQTVTATSETRDGDTLTVEGLSVALDQEEGGFTLTIDEVNFTDNGDGTVEITMSDRFPVTMAVPGEDGEGPTDLTIVVSQPGLAITVGGTSDEASYDFEAPTVNIKLESIDGIDADAVDVTADITMTAMTGNYLVSGPADGKSIDTAFGAQSMAMTLLAKDPEEQSDVRVVATLADLAGTSSSSFAGMDLMATNMADALKAGFATTATVTNGAMQFDLDVTEAVGPTKVSATSGGGGLSLSLDAAGLTYGFDGKATELTMSGAEIPFPELRMNYSEIAFNLMMPLLASAEPTDFTYLMRIVDLAVSDELWAMFDPTGTLPRDPATVIVDTKGKVRLTTDLVDEAAMATLGEAPPGELHAFDLTELRAKVAGAELTGSGALTFDNSDLVKFGGMPVPTGKVDLKLVGGNGLLDKLVTMGLVTADDVMGARMMLSMFANAGAGEDELTSTLEFKDKGFYANGQPIMP